MTKTDKLIEALIDHAVACQGAEREYREAVKEPVLKFSEAIATANQELLSAMMKLRLQK